MNISVDDLYNLAQDIINKNQNGYLSPDQFNLYIKQSEVSFLDYLLGEFQQYQYQRSQPRVRYSQNEVIRQRLTPFIYGYNLHIDSTGFAPYPADYQIVDAMWSYYGYKKIKYVQQDSLASYYNSRIDPIQTNPIYLVEQDGFRFYPNELGMSKLSYVQTPSPMYWAYTLDANGRPVYDPINSIQPQWYITDLFEILARLLRMVGVSIQANEVSMYANEITQKGQ